MFKLVKLYTQKKDFNKISIFYEIFIIYFW